MIDDVFRDRLRALADIEAAHAAHLEQISRLAESRRLVVAEMVSLAKGMGSRTPQAFVASRMGVSQQTVSKILAGRGRKAQ